VLYGKSGDGNCTRLADARAQSPTRRIDARYGALKRKLAAETLRNS